MEYGLTREQVDQVLDHLESAFDPNTAYDVLRTSNIPALNAQVGLELLAWLAKGGQLPRIPQNTRVGDVSVWRHLVVLRCEQALNRAINQLAVLETTRDITRKSTQI